jgi:phosphoribosyl 1,2-cyclic phosphodiesterase
MVRFTVLASGSKGNSSIVTHCPDSTDPDANHPGNRDNCTRILVDAGLSCRELFRRMRLVGEDPSTLDAIVITHEHQDHINGLAVTARKLGIPVYVTEATHRAWVRQMTPHRRITYAEWAAQYRQQREKAEAKAKFESRLAAESAHGPHPGPDHHPLPDPDPDPAPEPDPVPDPNPTSIRAASDIHCSPDPDPEAAAELAAEALAESAAEPARNPADLPAVHYFRPGEPFQIGDVSVSPFTIPHDAADPVGFVFTAEGVRLAVATDLGYMPPNVQAQLRRCDLIMLESNHDLEMLRDGPYPWSVKQRVLSRVGHLSNAATAQFLEDTYDGAATYLILAHLSESNNHPELARIAAEQALISKPSLLANRLYLATQHEPLSPVYF